MNQEKNPEPYQRHVRSFILRQSRLTKGQSKAIDEHWSTYGLEIEDGMLDYTQVFQREAPVIVEIGFGDGQSLLTQAQQNPQQDYIGIEVHAPGVGRLIMEAEKAKTRNIRIYRFDAVEVLQKCIPDNSLAGLQLFFPDPWPKKRHFKRRIVQPDFVQMVRQKLKVEGFFHMATDWEHYAQQMMEVLSDAPGFSNTSGEGQYAPRPESRPITKFETRGQNLGHGVWDLIFEKMP